MNKLLGRAAAVAAFALATSALAAPVSGFNGPLAPGQFSVINSGTLLGTAAPGTAVFTATDLTLTGSDSDATPGCLGGDYAVLTSPCQLSVVTALAGTFSFSWAYTTADVDGAAGDIFGVLVDGARFQLSDTGGSITQGGTNTFVARSSFGWLVNCTDCSGGAARVRISSVTFIPEPPALALALVALALLGATGSLRERRC